MAESILAQMDKLYNFYLISANWTVSDFFKIACLRNIDALKQEAKARKDELLKDGENHAESIAKIAAAQYILDTFDRELRMWLALRDDEFDEAWDYLIDAQNVCFFAGHAHQWANTFSHLQVRFAHIETSIFPAQVHASPKLRYGQVTCSICEGDYGVGDCDHVESMFYKGRRCSRTIQDIEKFHEMSVIEIPKDKRLRLTKYVGPSGATFNWMNQREINTGEKIKVPDKHHLFAFEWHFPERHWQILGAVENEPAEKILRSTYRPKRHGEVLVHILHSEIITPVSRKEFIAQQ